MQYGDNVDTLKSDGLQFLTFKLSFNDYYAQDISNKIKSVKQRKIEKGEYQAGIPPYGYKKDTNIKNHLVPDEYSSKIVYDIFDMYVNKGMSTIKIADELNRKEILPPAIYLRIPTYMKRNSSNPSGKYVWLRTQIGKILKNEVYIGNVVGRKFQKVSHKIAKVRCTKKEEHIVLKNMHEPIIDIDTWNKAQDKLSGYNKTRDRKYDHPLKGLIYCGECGNKATLRTREEKRKNGNIWRATYFICSKRNNYSKLCDCKQISANIVEDKIKEVLKKEMSRISITENEIKDILEMCILTGKNKEKNLLNKIQNLNKQLEKIQMDIEEIYQDKINKILQVEDFNKIYEKKQAIRKNIFIDIKKLKEDVEKEKQNSDKKSFKEMKNITYKLLRMERTDKIIYEKLINKIEFDKKRNIKIKFNFKNTYEER